MRGIQTSEITQIYRVADGNDYYTGEVLDNGITQEMIVVPSTDTGMCGEIYSNVNGFLNMIPMILILVIVIKMAATGSVDFKLIGLLVLFSMAMGVWYSLPLLC